MLCTFSQNHNSIFGLQSQEKRRFLPAVCNLIKILKLGQDAMAIKRKTYRFKGGEIIEVEEFHDGRYGAPGKKREKKKKPTTEQMKKVNAANKTKRCRHRMLEYINPGDCFTTWTYEVENRPPDMAAALKDFRDAIGYVRRAYKKRGKTLYWFRNIEQGTKGAWHIHLVLNEIGDTASIISRAWKKGATWFTEIKKSKYWDDDFTQMASYMTKDENTAAVKKDGTPGKPRLRAASYSTSRNMPLPEPKPDELVRWKLEPKPKKGYYILRSHEGINPFTGYKYRRYTMIRLRRRE